MTAPYPGTWFKDIFSIIAKKETSNLISGAQNVDCIAVDFTKNHFVAQPPLLRQTYSHRGM